MSAISLFQGSDGTWTAFDGIDPASGDEVGEYDDEDAALQAVKGERKDTILVVEDGETAGYTRKLELDGWTYTEA